MISKCVGVQTSAKTSGLTIRKHWTAPVPRPASASNSNWDRADDEDPACGLSQEVKLHLNRLELELTRFRGVFTA